MAGKELEKLSSNVTKRTNRSVRLIVYGLCILAGIIVIAVVITNAMEGNKKQVRLYSSEIDCAMQEKAAFINTIAAGASSGTTKMDYYAYVDEMVELYDDVSAVYICVKEDDSIYKDGIMTYMSGGWVPPEDFVVSERSWYKCAAASQDIYITEPYVDEQSGGICITLSKQICKDGEVIGVAGMDMYMDDLVTLIENSYHGGDYVFLVSGEGTVLTHPNKEFQMTAQKSQNVKDILKGKYEKITGKELSTSILFDYKGGMKAAICHASLATGWKVVSVSSVNWVFLLLLLITAITALFSIVVTLWAKKALLKRINPMFAPLEELALNISKIKEGKLDYHFPVDEQSEEVHALSVELNDTMRAMQNYISEITDTVTAISEKNLVFSVEGEYLGDYEKIKNALIEIMRVLNESFQGMNAQAAIVREYSDNLSETSESVAEAATIQNGAVMNASMEMKKLSENIGRIAEFASKIKENTDNANASLTLGNEEMKVLSEAMNEIAECYNEIAGFVEEINSIASETNLLALNASIEAARAGEMGKGFAVVAGEIGALSNSSSESSEKIKEVIQRSLSSVEKGKDLVEKTSKTIQESVEFSSENTEMVSEIVRFVNTQKESANEVSGQLGKISEMVESNAASAEENSAISVSLSESAGVLLGTVSEFRLRN